MFIDDGRGKSPGLCHSTGGSLGKTLSVTLSRHIGGNFGNFHGIRPIMGEGADWEVVGAGVELQKSAIKMYRGLEDMCPVNLS